MNSKKVFYVLLGILVIVFSVSVASTIYGTKSLKKTGDRLLELKLEDAVLSKDEQSLAQAKKDIEKYSSLEQVAKTIVPQEKDQVRTVREIVSLANESGVPIGNISFPTSTLGQPTKPGAKNPKASATAPAGSTQIVPVTGLTGVYAMPITVETGDKLVVPYGPLSNFLKKLEKNRRTSHITSISITPDDKVPTMLHFSLVINAYIKP